VFEITRSASEPPDAFQMQVDSKLGFLSSWGPQLSTVGWDVGRRNGGSPVNIMELENDPFSMSEGNRGSALYGLAVDLDEFGVSPLQQVSTIQFGSFGADSFDPVLFMGIRSASAVAGDFNSDGTVSVADYVVWRNILNTVYTQSDYDVWRAQFGQTAGISATHASVPEPTSAALTFFALTLMLVRQATPQSLFGSGSPFWRIAVSPSQR
jgi:hypothetical protein